MWSLRTPILKGDRVSKAESNQAVSGVIDIRNRTDWSVGILLIVIPHLHDDRLDIVLCIPPGGFLFNYKCPSGMSQGRAWIWLDEQINISISRCIIARSR